MFSKQDEINLLKRFVKSMPEGGYLSSMFTPQLTMHIEQQIRNDYGFIDHANLAEPTPPPAGWEQVKPDHQRWEQYIVDNGTKMVVYDANNIDQVATMADKLVKDIDAGVLVKVYGYVRGKAITQIVNTHPQE